MALFVPIHGQMSGSIAGNTFSRNRSGAYVRNRGIPVNPNTAGQQVVRGALGAAVSIWNNSLTVAEREAWNAYALTVTRTNALGVQYNPSGFQLVAGAIAWLFRANLPATGIATAPTTPGEAAAVVPQTAAWQVIDSAAASNAQTVGSDFSGTGGWNDSLDNDRLMVQIGLQQTPGTSFYRTPFSFLQSVVGNASTPPTDTNTAYNQSTIAGNVMWLRFTHLDPEFRMAPPVIKKYVIITN